jgi:3',5'-cyclic-AMP phosphodiesterase
LTAGSGTDAQREKRISSGTGLRAVAKIKASSETPSFLLHTGDLTHLSKPEEFDTLQQIPGERSPPIFYVPGAG